MATMDWLQNLSNASELNAPISPHPSTIDISGGLSDAGKTAQRYLRYIVGNKKFNPKAVAIPTNKLELTHSKKNNSAELFGSIKPTGTTGLPTKEWLDTMSEADKKGKEYLDTHKDAGVVTGGAFPQQVNPVYGEKLAGQFSAMNRSGDPLGKGFYKNMFSMIPNLVDLAVAAGQRKAAINETMKQSQLDSATSENKYREEQAKAIPSEIATREAQTKYYGIQGKAAEAAMNAKDISPEAKIYMTEHAKLVNDPTYVAAAKGEHAKYLEEFAKTNKDQALAQPFNEWYQQREGIPDFSQSKAIPTNTINNSAQQELDYNKYMNKFNTKGGTE